MHTAYVFSHHPCMAEIIFVCRRSNPISPANLTFDHANGLIAGVVYKIFEENPSSQDGDVYRAW